VKNVCSILALVTCLALLAAAPDEKASKPRYDEKGQFVRPADYCEWIFLSAGYGMNYSPAPDSHDRRNLWFKSGAVSRDVYA